MARVRTTLPLEVRTSWLPEGERPAEPPKCDAVLVVRVVDNVVRDLPPAVVVVREVVVVVVRDAVVGPCAPGTPPAGLAAGAGLAGAAGLAAGADFFV